jgi:DNA repair protein RecO (recombination protein O)
MHQQTKAIVLHALKYGDTSIIAHLYTSEFGRQSYIVQGVRKKRSKFHYNNFQPLTILDLEVDHKPQRELQRIRELNLIYPLNQVHSDFYKNSIALFIGEVLYRTLRDTEGNKPLFDYLINAIQILEINESGYINFHVIFLIHFTRFIGIFPENREELDNFQPEKSSLKVHDLLNYSLKDLHKLRLDNNSRIQILDAIVDYYYYHIEGIGKISSLKVLHEVFS